MTATATEPAISLGHPSYVWRRGQERRLSLIRDHVALEGSRILDVGCGIGTYVSRFREFSDEVYGVEIEFDRVRVAARKFPNVFNAAAEGLPFRDNSFDVILLHEVIEHVRNDRETVREAVRCVRPGGAVVIFAPNRLYLFETHGFFLGKRFVFRLLPFINYTPDIIRNLFCHHVRIYTQRGIRELFDGLDVEFTVSSHIFPGFDNVARRRPFLGRVLHGLTDFAERTPLRMFGISHFVVARKQALAWGPADGS
ncbi:MAG: methyltransferase domain-containing protein [Chloroflexi bacterium]|nr:methyltransferase domain-containing protein [Chloroflexota bacterium]